MSIPSTTPAKLCTLAKYSPRQIIFARIDSSSKGPSQKYFGLPPTALYLIIVSKRTGHSTRYRGWALLTKLIAGSENKNLTGVSKFQQTNELTVYSTQTSKYSRHAESEIINSVIELQKDMMLQKYAPCQRCNSIQRQRIRFQFRNRF